MGMFESSCAPCISACANTEQHSHTGAGLVHGKVNFGVSQAKSHTGQRLMWEGNTDAITRATVVSGHRAADFSSNSSEPRPSFISIPSKTDALQNTSVTTAVEGPAVIPTYRPVNIKAGTETIRGAVEPKNDIYINTKQIKNSDSEGAHITATSVIASGQSEYSNNASMHVQDIGPTTYNAMVSEQQPLFEQYQKMYANNPETLNPSTMMMYPHQGLLPINSYTNVSSMKNYEEKSNTINSNTGNTIVKAAKAITTAECCKVDKNEKKNEVNNESITEKMPEDFADYFNAQGMEKTFSAEKEKKKYSAEGSNNYATKRAMTLRDEQAASSPTTGGQNDDMSYLIREAQKLNDTNKNTETVISKPPEGDPTLEPTIEYKGAVKKDPEYCGNLNPISFKLHAIELHQYIPLPNEPKTPFIEMVPDSSVQFDPQAFESVFGAAPEGWADSGATGVPAPLISELLGKKAEKIELHRRT